MRIHRIVWLLLGAVLLYTDARADMLEVKNKGFLNGTIVSETDTQIKLKDADGNVQTFSKKDVTYIQKEDAAPKKLTGVNISLPKIGIDLKKAVAEKASAVHDYLEKVGDSVQGQEKTEDLSATIKKREQERAREKERADEQRIEDEKESIRGIYSEKSQLHSEDVHRANGSSNTRHTESASSSKYNFKQDTLASHKVAQKESGRFDSL